MIKNYLNSISSKKRGIIFLLMSSFSFAVMALFVNLAGDMPVFMKAFFRNIVACLLTIPMLARSSGGFKIQKGNLPYLIGRATLGTVGIFCNFYAISQINIADALILNKLSPFFAIIASVFILGEVANGWQWLAVVVALAGSIFVVKPTFIFGLADSGFDSARFFPAMIGLIGGVAAGVAYTFLRRLSLRGERSTVIVAFFSVFSCIACIPFIILTYRPVTLVQILFCFCAGIAACCGQFTITAAYGACPASEISVYDYSTVIFAAILGMAFLDEFPDLLSIIGYIVIIGASVFAFLYNNGYILRKKSIRKPDSAST
ncbi:MAG: DMT family transporter [Mageeibacillus sp.]|jgi:drug/metabolite transporter (DMT)-like permease|nr:DMT family transporter [Mageeibacillus sp.]MCI1264701.1 DMT family transporter [Saccharofermentans sp.]MCI2043904.1 DMT family transporter [Mageeibacillus sp.]